MFDWLKSPSSSRLLTESQRRMYASETTENFRFVARLSATPSSYTLTSTDLAAVDLEIELAEIGQFAEVAHGKLSPEFIWNNIESLSEPAFPLHGYTALRGSALVSAFRGTVGGLQGYTAYREPTKQLVVAFSGTSSISQTFRNFDVRLVAYPPGGDDGCAVHSGFWKMYNGLRSFALDGLVRGLSTHDAIEEIVLTGHSLGAVMCYLLALDIFAVGKRLPENASGSSISSSISQIPLKLAVFGCPRIGNEALAQYWRGVVADRVVAVKEYSVKGFNDGVPAIPPCYLGYRHLAQTPLYFAQGCLYHVPTTESEHSFFPIGTPNGVNENGSREEFLEHPLGGHNYYNRRDMERLLRRMKWFDSIKEGEIEWGQYREWLQKEGEI